MAIEINNVTFTYPGAESPILRNVSLTINKGEFIAIVGGNGSGKSTLCKLMNGLIPHYYVGDFEGEVLINGHSSLEGKVSSFSEQVGYVYQDFENQLVRPTVLDDASFAPLNFGFSDYKERGKRALEIVGLVGYDKEFIWQLSGGQKHLLALAGALSLDPDILIIDEPVAQLDPCHAKEVYEILRKLHTSYGKTIIVIEHHTEFIADYCEQVVLMDNGQVAWKKPTKQGLLEVESLMDRQIYPPQVTQAAYQLGDEGPYPLTLAEAVDYFRKDSTNQSTISELGHDDSISKESYIKINNLKYGYKTINRDKKMVLKNLNLTINRGDLIALIGNNGAGKSSLMKLLTGLVKPDSGEVLVNGFDTKNYKPEKLADFVTYIYQNPEEMFIEDSIRKDVEFFLKARRVENFEGIVDEILEQFELTHLQQRDGRLMSGGQQRRASLAIGVAMNPSVILLDEPTANLDIATRKHITKLISKLENSAETVIVATHDMQLVAEWANRIIVLSDGEVIHDGTRETVFSNNELLKQAGLEAPQIVELSRRLGMKPLTYTVRDFVHYMERRRVKSGLYTQTV
ncbi:ABC transporter ATP-binding protein [Metabacillus malikii]|uniref:Energy-coupling factor transport system ATP-binding protein n=1 Tax=Metabacillus malikii TaxID=1504265 RepID=A0ABT9ZF35_9BACI|nr:energy-coupling factor transporter ATPase [Metabacillus malikii]MDQ0230849.1 energy-coupling factor transport system ATP-binding protein [Metabacillus malikii]